jgi:hypothetical protein
VRLFHPDARYPAGRIASPNALYWGAPDLTFMATWSEPWDWFKREMPYTEMDWATPQELRLMASILMCEPQDGPPTCFYPIHRFSMLLDAQDLNLESPVIACRIKDSIIERSSHPDMHQGEGAIEQCLNGEYHLLKKSDLDIPPHCLTKSVTRSCGCLSRNVTHKAFGSKRGFATRSVSTGLGSRTRVAVARDRPVTAFMRHPVTELREATRGDITRQPELFDQISTEDHLFLRGVAALLKAEMLTTHYEFWEEAIVIPEPT